MEFPATAALVGATLIILQQALMLNTGFHRAKSQIVIGTGTDRNLERKVRRHGNLAENAAIFVVVLALAELRAPESTALIYLGAAFVVARLAHSIAFVSLAGSHRTDEGSKVFLVARAIGAFGTAVSGIALGGYLAYLLLV